MAQNGLRSMRTVTHFALLLGVAAMACGVTAKQSDFSGPGAGGSSGTAGTSSGVGSLSGSGSGSYLTSGSTVGPITDAGGTASASDSGRQPRCTDAGCTCFNIASIGHLGS